MELFGNFDSKGILHFQPESGNFERQVYELQKISIIMAIKSIFFMFGFYDID